jgi:hypothetical protein
MMASSVVGNDADPVERRSSNGAGRADPYFFPAGAFGRFGGVFFFPVGLGLD